MPQDEMIDALKELTKLRRAGVNDRLFDSILETLQPGVPRKITSEELEQRRVALEAKLPDWWVI